MYVLRRSVGDMGAHRDGFDVGRCRRLLVWLLRENGRLVRLAMRAEDAPEHDCHDRGRCWVGDHSVCAAAAATTAACEGIAGGVCVAGREARRIVSCALGLWKAGWWKLARTER